MTSSTLSTVHAFDSNSKSMPLRVLVDEVPQTEEIAKTCDGFIKMVILCRLG